MAAPEDPPGNMLESGASIVRSLNLTNVLIVALLVIVAVPSYFAYRFMTDAEFRGEFMSGANVLEKFRRARCWKHTAMAASPGTPS